MIGVQSAAPQNVITIQKATAEHGWIAFSAFTAAIWLVIED
jgi:hypothetical protein